MGDAPARKPRRPDGRASDRSRGASKVCAPSSRRTLGLALTRSGTAEARAAQAARSSPFASAATAAPPSSRSRTSNPVSTLVPCLEKARGGKPIRATTRPLALNRRIRPSSMRAVIGTTAARRPPSARAEKAPVRCASRSVKGGLQTATSNPPAPGNRFWTRRPSRRDRVAETKRPSSRTARPSASSFSVRTPPQASATIAISPVPAEGSSTWSPGRT